MAKKSNSAGLIYIKKQPRKRPGRVSKRPNKRYTKKLSRGQGRP